MCTGSSELKYGAEQSSCRLTFRRDFLDDGGVEGISASFHP